ncbi:hypothetical protein FQN50_008709 [Emmonsiellopsis sp. PD_5]|nr:hypothetical protein FQN50_008709 [Emmonsiellopsis sp. PD_5]
MSNTPTPISILGLGAMGTVLATQFLKATHKTTVWNRTPSKAAALIDQGAIHAPAITAAAAASPLVMICLLDNDSVSATLQQDPAAWQGKTIVNLTNGTPSQARQTAEWAVAHGAEYIHGGIMAIPPMIGQPHAVLLYSGPSAVFKGLEPTLSLLGTSGYVGEDVGLASLHDLALLSGMYGMFSGFVQAAALVRSAKIPVEEFVTAELVPWLTAMMGSLPVMAKQVDGGSYETPESSLGMQAQAVPNFFLVGEEQGVGGELIGPILRLIQERAGRGGGADGIAALVEEVGRREDKV